jgi:hypothetical protein
MLQSYLKDMQKKNLAQRRKDSYFTRFGMEQFSYPP